MLRDMQIPTTRRQLLKTTAAGMVAFSSGSLIAQQKPVASNSKLIIHSTDAMNAEPHLPDLVKDWMTPVEHFYIRSHAPIPKIDVKAFRLTVVGLVDKPLSISLAELAEFKQHEIVATMTCAGNRRTEHSLVKPVSGVPWGAGAIGNAKWGGVSLADVLKKAGLKSGARHVWFEGLDAIRRGDGTIPFGASIPIHKAWGEGMDGALLTTRMNGARLNGDHGAPLRAVVPNYIGARSVKWLGRIVVSDRPSPNHYVETAYKLVQEGSALEWSEQGPIYRMPLNSVICSPNPNAKLKPGLVDVAGYALPPGRPGATISKVEVSANNGRTWSAAKIVSPVRTGCWVLWMAVVPITTASADVMVRATDSQGKTQPSTVDWNQKGYLFNAWHRVPIRS